MNGSAMTNDVPEADLVDLSLLVWKSRRLVVLFVIGVGGLFATFAFTATSVYRAEVVLVQVEPDSSQGLLGKVGDLASLAGISPPGVSRGQARVAVLKSHDLAREFVEQERLEPLLEEADQGNFISKLVARLFGAKPDSRDALRFFDQQVRDVDDDKKAGVIRLGMKWTDPEVAAKWANDFAERADLKLREAAHREAEQNVAYLQSQLAKTNIPAMQQSLGKLLESEMGKMLLTRGGVDYAFTVIDRATPPKERYSPKRLLLVSVGAVVGLVIGIGAAIFLNLVIRPKWR